MVATRFAEGDNPSNFYPADSATLLTLPETYVWAKDSRLQRAGGGGCGHGAAEGKRHRHDFQPEPQADWVKTMAKKMERAECRACYRLRKQAMGFRQFLLRGLEKVEGEWALVTLACNCRRLHNLRIAANRT